MAIKYENHIYFGEVNMIDMFDDKNTAKEYEVTFEERKRLDIKIRELNNIIKNFMEDSAATNEKKTRHLKTIEGLTALYVDADNKVKALELLIREKLLDYTMQYLDFIIDKKYKHSQEILRKKFDFKAQYITKKIQMGVDSNTGEVLDLRGLFITFPVKNMIRNILKYPRAVLGAGYASNDLYIKAKVVKEKINLSKTIFYTDKDIEDFLQKRFRRVVNLNAKNELEELYDELKINDLKYLMRRGCYATTTLRDDIWNLEYDAQLFYKLQFYLDANTDKQEVIRKYVVVPPKWDGQSLQKRLVRYVLDINNTTALDEFEDKEQ